MPTSQLLVPSSSHQGSLPCRVVVLMSTYNGLRYIDEQLDSILSQLPADGRLIVRDDGSLDATADHVEARLEPRITVIRGSNLGFSRSFLSLLAAAPQDADMVMFSDQDDVWMPDKVARAWAHLLPLADAPALYGSAQMLVDERLRQLRPTRPWTRAPSLRGALTENIITGCTAAFNRPALQLLQRAGVPENVHLHDWWAYLVVSAFGRVVWDDRPSILYRQHGQNQIGHGAGWWDRQRQIVRFLLRNDWVGILVAQVQALDAHYGEQLPLEARCLLNRYFARSKDAWLPGWTLIFSLRRWRQNLVWELALRVLLATYRLRLWPLPSRRIDTMASQTTVQ